MGIPISAPILHRQEVRTDFRANSICGWVFEGIGLLTVLMIPIVIGFSMGQFWIHTNSFSEFPQMNYTGRMLLRAIASDGSEYLWSTSERLQAALIGDERHCHPFFSLLAEDPDQDNKPNTFVFNIKIPLRNSTHNIVSVQFLPTFQYKLSNDLLNIEMETGPLVAYEGENPQQSRRLVIDGTLPFHQLDPIVGYFWYSYDKIYKRSYFDEVKDIADLRNVASIGAKYNARNESTPFQLATAYFTDTERETTAAAGSTLTGTGGSAAFTVTITMRVPNSFIVYVPSIAESLKAAWIQYFCIAYVIRWAFGIIRAIAVENALVDTVAEFNRPRRLLE